MPLTKWERILLEQQRPIDQPEPIEEIEEDIDEQYDRYLEREEKNEKS